MSAVSDWKTYVGSVYAQRNAALAEITALQTLIAAAAAALKPNYSVSMPEGSQSVDWAGELAALNASLDAQMAIVERVNLLIEKFPYQFTSRAV